MISLTVVSYNGAPPEPPLHADFDEIGGTIGRGDNNQLVLPDPDRTISRVHAQVVFRSGGYAIVDRGSNAISVNDRPVGNGHEAPLKDGDQLQIGGYLLSVRQTAATLSARGPAAAADPFADLFGAAPPAARGRAGAAPSPVADPFAAFAAAPPTAPAPFADPPAPRPPSRGFTPAPPAASSASGIPEDWDPFAADVPAPPARGGAGGGGARSLGLDVGAAAPMPLISGLSGGGGDDSLDKLFGLKPGTGDPLANSALNEAAAKPNMAANADPLRSLNSAPRASTATEADNLSDLQRPFRPATPAPAPVMPVPTATPAGLGAGRTIAPMPAARPAAEPTGARTGLGLPPADTGGLPSSAVLSWHDPSADGHTVIRPPGRSAAPVPAAAPPAALPAPVAPTAVLPAAQPAAVASDTAALLAAFRAGLATPSLQIDALTPELMNLVGQLLREAAQGTVDLLVARAAIKREVRAEATMIVAKENNPLKFSPSAEAALGHLLSPPTRGFMPAAPAMRDAYADLRAHQFGVVAGLKAALEGVLARFDPAQLESRLVRNSALQSILAGGRKARMWEMYTEMYGGIRSEAADDFHSLFGKAFVQAYESHIDALRSQAPPQGSP